MGEAPLLGNLRYIIKAIYSATLTAAREWTGTSISKGFLSPVSTKFRKGDIELPFVRPYGFGLVYIGRKIILSAIIQRIHL